MQGRQPINMSLVVEEYRETVIDMTNEVIMLRAYVKQLESQLQELLPKPQEPNNNNK